MKKRMTKLFSLALAVLMLVSVFSIAACAYSDDYVTIDCPEYYDEYEYASMDVDGYINIWYDEWYLAEDGEEHYTGNTVDLYVETPFLFEVPSVEDYYNEEDFEWAGEYAPGTIENSTYYYMQAGDYQAVAYDYYYNYNSANESGVRQNYKGLYSEITFITGSYIVTIDIDVCYADDLLVKRNEIVETFVASMNFNDDAAASLDEENKSILTIIGAVLIGGFLIVVTIVVVVIVVAVKSSKKKKAQRAAYPYNNMNNVPPQYYNPNGQMPYGNQNVNVPPQTPPSYVQPPVSEPATTEETAENNTENLDN